jgi:hypothetical protein
MSTGPSLPIYTHLKRYDASYFDPEKGYVTNDRLDGFLDTYLKEKTDAKYDAYKAYFLNLNVSLDKIHPKQH